MSAMRAGLGGLVLSLAAAGLCGCGGDDDEGSGGSGPTCGTVAEPLLLQVTGLSPAPGSTVANAGIEHSFTVVDSPALFPSFFFMTAAGHTAGNFVFEVDPQVLMTPTGTDVVYEATPMHWENAPAEVSFSVWATQTAKVITFEGCYYALPEPLFSYSVDPAGAGGAGGAGGQGGAGGAGGSAGAGGAGGG